MKYINTLITNHGNGEYTLSIQGDDVTIKAFSHGYQHRPGNHVNLGLSDVTLVDMTELATSILMSIGKQVGKKKKEGAKINATVNDLDYEVLMGAMQLADSNFGIEYDQLPFEQREKLYNKAEEIIRNNRVNAKEDR